MASIIRIKRSEVAGNPATLAAGELAYSGLTDNGSNGGDRLYIGLGTETTGNAVNHYVIGGKYFTDKLDHTPGVLTASSALIVDSNSKLDNFNVDNININGNAISSTDTNGNITITPNGTGSIVLDGQSWPQAAGTNGHFLTTTGGVLSWASIPSGSFTIAGNSGSDSFSTGGTLTFTGTAPVVTAVTNDVVTFSLSSSSVTIGSTSVALGGTSTTLAGLTSVTMSGATSGTVQLLPTAISGTTVLTLPATTGTLALVSQLPTVNDGTLTLAVSGTGLSGSASFTANQAGGSTFTVTSNATAVNTASAIVARDGSGNFAAGTITAALSGNATTATTLATGRTIAITGPVTGTATSFNGSANISIPVTAVDVSHANITGTLPVARGGTGVGTSTGTGSVVLSASPALTGTPTAPTAAGGTATTQIATTAFVDAAIAASQTGLTVKQAVKAATVGAITLSGTQTVDGVALSVADRVLVKDQASAPANGIYVVAAGAWTRATDADADAEVKSGMFFFVEQGTVNADSGWTLTTENPIVVGTTGLAFAQFSGAGQIVAGAGLTKTGNTLNVGAGTGITVNADDIALTGQALALHNLATSGVIVRTGAGTVAGRTLTGTASRLLITNGDGVSGNPTFDIDSAYVGQTSITTLGTVATGTWSATAIGATKGGTAQTTWAVGDLLYASGVDTLAKLTKPAAVTSLLQMTSAGSPSWLSLAATGITGVGTLTTGTWNATAVASGYGGTGFTTYSTGDLIYASAANTLSKLTAGADGKVLQINGSGVPVWGDVDGGTY